MYNTLCRCIENNYIVPIIITAKASPEYTRTATDFEEIAEHLGITIIISPTLNSKAIFEKIEEANCDLGLSVNYSGIISAKIINLFPIGILNAHGGDLPRYRGNACQAWAIINGEERIGLAIYKMKGGYLDGGELILKEYLYINEKSSITDCWLWLNNTIPNAFIKAVKILEKDKNYLIEDTTKSEIESIRCYPRLPEDGEINWTKNNLEIVRLIKASCEPYGGAFCTYEGEKMIIWKADLFFDEENYFAQPGQISSINNGSIDVITGRGKIRIIEIEYRNIRSTPDQVIKSIRKRLK